MQCNEICAHAPGKENMELSGIVFDTQRFSIHDGHGIRTLIFLKGCPLSCEWCTNPESQKFAPQIGLFADKCAGCMKCADYCPNGRLFREEGRIAWQQCTGCLKCVDACLYGARELYGVSMSVDEVMDIARRDKVFFDKTGGGVTLGGGEATAQPAFAREILKRCRAEGIHTALETCGYAPWKPFEGILQNVNLLLYDFKNMDSAAHKEKTGVGNELILDNAIKASNIVDEMIARFPLIPDYNDSEQNAHRMGSFIQKNINSIKRVDILKYHSVGESKHTRIGREYMFRYKNELSDEKVNKIKEILVSYGLEVSIGG